MTCGGEPRQWINCYHLGFLIIVQFTPKAVAGYERTIAKNVDLWTTEIASESHKSGGSINIAASVRLLQFDSRTLLATLNWVGIITKMH